MIRRSLFLILPMVSTAFAAIDVAGTVTDATSDIPLPKVRIFGPDSSFLDATDPQGRFLLKLVRPQEVVFRKEGYRDRVVALAELGNLLDVQVDLEPLGTRLETGIVTGSTGRRRPQVGTIAAIEDVSGMRFDLQEHLRTLPGVGGTREFSSEVSVYGSRTADVAHVLGPFAIPNLRHLDHSFPGNQSVLNPRVLQNITVEHDPVSGPLEQGLASALRYQPRRASPDKYEFIASLGLTNREFDAFLPAGDGSVVASLRWLDPGLLEHLGGRFFTGGSGRTADDNTSSGPVAKIGLEAGDAYGRVEQGVGGFALSATALAAYNDYTVSLKTQPFGVATPSFVPVTQGDRTDWVAFTDLQGDLGSGYLQAYAGAIGREETQLLSDTTLYAETETVQGSNVAQSNPKDWGAWTRSTMDLRVGGLYRPTATILGAEAEILGSVDQISEEYFQGRTFKSGTTGSELQENRRWLDIDRNGVPNVLDGSIDWVRTRTAGRLRWQDDSTRYGLSVGGLWAQEAGWANEFTLSAMTPAWGIGWLANVSLRAKEYSYAQAPAKMSVATTSGWEGKVGAGRRVGPVELTGTLYGRKLTDPELPVPEFWRALPLAVRADEATVVGAAFQTRFDGWQRARALVNLSRVQGEYAMADGSVLEWDANRDLDILTELRVYPMEDTLFSVIVTHVASLGKPQYAYALDTLSAAVEIAGDPAVAGGSPRRDAFRTDVRMELWMPARISPIQGMRFYAEVQNLFSGFSGDWARVLGGDNFRARSMEPDRVKEPERVIGPGGVEIDNPNAGSWHVIGARPLYARGTDLFLTFGLEGNLGF